MGQSKPIARKPNRPQTRTKTVRYADRVDAIQQQRARRMDEIRVLNRLRPVAGGFTQKAETLLTAGWGRASLDTRADILRTVDWLLGMERMHGSV